MGDGAEVTVVLDAEGLRGAIEHGSKHIELRSHLDLTALTPLLDGLGVSRDKLLGYLAEEVQTIRGRCDREPLQTFAAPLSDIAELAPIKPSQCLIVTDIDLLTVRHRSVWLDNLYLRLRRSERSPTPLLVTVDPPGELYMTNVTMQGDSVGPCQALVARSPTLLQNSELLNMAGGTSVVLVEGGTVSLHSTLFSNVFVPDPAALVQAELPGSAARLQNVTLQAVTAAHPFRVGGDGSIYSDANITVYDDTAQTDTAARSFADIPDERLFLATGDEWFVQLQRDLENARFVAYSAPSKSGISGNVLVAVIVSVAAVLVLACVLVWRRTRHRLSFDAWGLPVRHLKSDRATDANSNALSPLPSRSLGPRGSIGLESGQSISSASAARAPSVPHSGLPTSRTNHDAADTEPESCTGTIDKSTIELPPGQGSNPSQVDIRSASTLSDARSKHSPSTPWQLPRRDPASLPRAAHGNHVRPLRPLHSSTHIQFASSILETFPHGFPDGQPSPSREMRGTGGIHQLALASAPQLTRELMDALPPEPKSGTSPISTLGAPYRHDVSDTLTAGATDISPRAGESAMAVLQHIPGRSFRRVPADTTEGGSSTGVGSNATPAHQGPVETTGPGSSAGIASTAPPLRWGPVDTTGPGSSPGVASHATASRWGPIDVPEPGSSAGVISHATLSRRGPIDVTEPGSSAGVASHTAPSRWGPIDVAEPGSSTGVASHATPSRWEPVDITEPGYSAGVASHATPPRRGDSLPLAELAPADRAASHTHSVHLSSLDRGGGSGSEIEVLDPHNMGVYTPVMHASGTAGAVPSVPFHANRGPPRHVLPPVGASMLARGSTPNARWLQPRNQDAVGGPWRMHSSQGSEATSGDISGTPDTDMTQTQPQLPLPPGNMGGNSASVGGNSANIGASPFLPTPRRMAMGGQGAQLAVAGDRAEGARAVEDAPGAAMHALNRYRARVAAQVQAGASSGTDTASGLAGGTATMGDLSAGQSSWLDGTGDLTPPPPHASTDEKLDHIDAQLDSLTRTTVLNLYELFGGNERRRGGQAIIQFAKRLHSREEFALKFFLNRTDFEAEAACYRSAHLGSFMPAVERYVDNDDGTLRDAAGNPMPPCIIIERGESLRDRMQLAHTDKAGTAQVLVNVARRLADLHDAGWVHRDLKPGNVLWLPRKQRWTLIDFALAASVGTDASVVFTPSYAAPEIIRAAVEKRHAVKASAAMDAWALGVMAFELLTGCSVFDHQEPDMKKVYSQLLGDEPLPWEGERLTAAMRKSLGIFRTNVLRLLDRNPSKRMTMQQFANACDAIFDSRTIANRGRNSLSVTQ